MIDQNHTTGVIIMSSTATIDGTVIRNTQPQASDMAVGAGVVVGTVSGPNASLSLVDSLIDQNRYVGVIAANASLNVSTTLVQNTQPQASDQAFGDGISVNLGDATIESTLLQGNTRASVSNFGSTITLRSVEAICSPIFFNEERVDQAETLCAACGGSTTRCVAVSEHLEPPSPVPPLDSPKHSSQP
jgi:hypothetical protein